MITRILAHCPYYGTNGVYPRKIDDFVIDKSIEIPIRYMESNLNVEKLLQLPTSDDNDIYRSEFSWFGDPEPLSKIIVSGDKSYKHQLSFLEVDTDRLWTVKDKNGTDVYIEYLQRYEIKSTELGYCKL